MHSELHINFSSDIPKYLSISEGIMDAIRNGSYEKGHKLPSINELSIENLVSRDTVEKAYKELRDQGIIESVRGKGYFVKRTDVHRSVRILLVFNKLSNYKKQIYNAFRNTLGKNAKVDLKIHHWDIDILNIIIENNKNQYDYVVVMPHFYGHTQEAINILKKIPPHKLILLDRDLPEMGKEYTAIYQDFRKDIIEALEEASPLLEKYNKLVYVNPTITPYPPEIKTGFRNFSMINHFDFSIIDEMTESTPVKKGEAYIVISETDLVELIKRCTLNNLKIGEDVGIISYNETPLKEILLDGITVISTDHIQMGKTAAEIILNKQHKKIKNPFRLIQRKSI